MVNSQFCHNATLPQLIPKSTRSTDKTLLNFYLIFHKWQKSISENSACLYQNEDRAVPGYFQNRKF
jgi:hypothetical protein